MIYTIPKGHHYSVSKWHFRPLLFHEDFNFTFKLSKECAFPVIDRDDLDINKIFGRSFGFHHTNSFRLGWSPKKDNSKWVDLYAYYYNNSIPYHFHIGTICTETEYRVILKFNRLENNIEAKVYSGNTLVYINPFSFHYPVFLGGYLLYAYFGGNKPAGQDTQIEIKYYGSKI